jgi:HEAT repeat protein
MLATLVTMPTEPAADRLFTRVLVDGTDEAIAHWIAAGPESVHRLHQELTGELRAALPEGISQRELLDNLKWAAHEVARAFPDEFLAAFADGGWDESPSVCSGLGAIRRPAVTERLMRMLRSENHWLRIDAAVALRGHQHPDLRAVLLDALQDPDYLVRYHIEERLAELDGHGSSPDPGQ